MTSTPQPAPGSALPAAIERIAQAYRSRWHQGYARGKLRHDPAFAAIAARLSGQRGGVLDIGCGLGLLGLYLREHGWRGGYLGLDVDAAKIEAARAAAARRHPDLAFTAADAGAALPHFRGNVVMLDVLHYLPTDAQPRLLAAAAERVAPGGVLLIRSVVRSPGWRFAATRILEACAYRCGWLASPARHFPGAVEIIGPLVAAGLRVTQTPLWGHTPFASHLFEAVRDATVASGRDS